MKRELRCRSYVRYVDDFALFSDSRKELWAWKRAIVARMAMLRLRVHERTAQVTPVSAGIPWLGFIVFPTHRRVKARCVRNFTRCIRTRSEEYHLGEISFAEFVASVKGWINHLRFADTWGLRGFVLRQLPGVRPRVTVESQHRSEVGAPRRNRTFNLLIKSRFRPVSPK